MGRQSIAWIGVIVVGVVAVAALAAYASTQLYTIPQYPIASIGESLERLALAASAIEGTSERSIYVSGVGTIQTTPDEAIVYLTIEVSDNSAVTAQTEASNRMASVIKALKEIGIADEHMKTTQISLTPIRDDKTGLQIIGYTARNSLMVTVKNIEKTGTVVEEAIEAGANRLDYLTFQVSAEKAQSLRAEALRLAVLDAKTQAETAASAAGTRVIGLKSLSIGGVYLPVKTVSAAEAVPRDVYVMPGEAQINAHVSATFLIE